MLQAYWFGIGGFATLMTLGYLYRPTERTTFTSLFAAGGWVLMAITATDLQTMTETGERVAAPVPIAGQLFVAGLALLSMLAAFLYRWGLYPPDESTEDDA